MTMTPALRKLVLTAHVAVSVSWLGAVATFLILSIAGLVSENGERVRGAYLAMDLIGWSVIVPLSLASLTTGLIQAFGSQWGLIRHYWILTKFFLTVVAATLLLLHQYSAVGAAAKRVLGAAAGTLPSVGSVGVQLVLDATLAVLALLTTTTLAVYKPRGLTRYGQRRLEAQSKLAPQLGSAGKRDSLGLAILLATLGAIVIVAVTVHVLGLAGHHGESGTS